MVMNKKQYQAPAMQTLEALPLDAVLLSTSIDMGGTGDPRVKGELDFNEEELYEIFLGWDRNCDWN